MTKPRIDEASIEELERELARRRAQHAPMDMTAMELTVELEEKTYGQLALQERLDQLPDEDGKPKRCPRCGALVTVKSQGRKRTLRSVSGDVVLFRNYYYCSKCRHGFYPRDEELGIPKNGEVSRELEKRILDFAMNDSFEHASQRWNTIFRQSISANLLRRVVDRVGILSEECHEAALQHEIKQCPDHPPGLLIIQTDVSMLPLRGSEPWKEAKLGVIFDGDHWLVGRKGQRGSITQSRYVGILGKQKDFSSALDIALRMERALKADKVVWVADGAAGNWTLAEKLVPECIQVLDWHHAIENAMTCAKVILGETNPYLSFWKERVEALLSGSKPEQVLEELEQCFFICPRKGRGAIKKLLSYYRNNIRRMRYQYYLSKGYPIGSGIVESAHRHVLQKRMKNAGQHWSLKRARRMVRLRSVYRTTGPCKFHSSILKARELTKAGEFPRFGPLKQRASNRGTSGVRVKQRGRHSRY